MKKLILILILAEICFAFPLSSEVARWKLNEQSGTSIVDSAGTNTGTWTGTEQIADGDFTASTGWTEENGWSIAVGVAVHTGGTAGNLINSVSLTVGKTYTLTFDIDAIGDGVCNLFEVIDSVTHLSFNSAGASQTGVFTMVKSGFIALRTNSTNVTIDNVSVREHVVPVPSPTGMGLLFDGVDDKITVPADSAIDANGKTALTITAWINPSSDGESNTGRIVDKYDSSSAAGYRLFLSNESGTSFKINASIVHATQPATAKTGAITGIKDVWGNVAFVYNEDGAKKIKIYLNGVLQANTDTDDEGIDAIVNDNANPLLIGNLVGGVRAFDGSISDVRIYDVALTQVEIADIMNITNRRSRRAPR